MSIYNSGHLAGTFYWTLTTIPCCGHGYYSRLVDENAEFFTAEAANSLPQDREAVAAGAMPCCLTGKPHLYIRHSTRRINFTSVLRHRHAALLHALRTKYPVDRGEGGISSVSTGTRPGSKAYVLAAVPVPVGQEAVDIPKTYSAVSLTWFVITHESCPEAFRNI